MSHTSLFIHIIFRTKSSIPAIEPEKAKSLYRYIWGIVKKRNSVLCRINGMPDHLHMLIEINPTLALSDLVREIKASTSRWLKKSGEFPLFLGWASEYAAFSYAAGEKETLIRYIKNQQEHHKRVSFRDELEALYKEFGIADDLPYFLED